MVANYLQSLFDPNFVMRYKRTHEIVAKKKQANESKQLNQLLLCIIVKLILNSSQSHLKLLHPKNM